MEIIVTEYTAGSEVTIRNASGINLHTYSFENKGQVNAFLCGFRCSQMVANSLIQSMPSVHKTVKA
jgi:S-adenosylmethionine/arginine decarboxylase-like enzyme